ncbi:MULTISPECIES: hypothetical protein [unclassified Paenibacillus]|uniref:hypothetical protein n=1 Tax=unclassified Paenibacillus TaxID=185978 RepID=UPI002405AA2D|nr:MULTISPECIES: hypothetical protein [unclassified Paenibacillus]MDF9847410.1 hypothetical protein [Paenibacillus sp. PastM-2]MDH6479285.1 hypothetical protein [Paenibacillus sp. PastH-2]
MGKKKNIICHDCVFTQSGGGHSPQDKTQVETAMPSFREGGNRYCEKYKDD